MLEKEVKASQGRAKKPRDYTKSEATKCNMCKGTYLYINSNATKRDINKFPLYLLFLLPFIIALPLLHNYYCVLFFPYYILEKHEEKPSMLQKYYNYVINVIKINNINNLIRNVNFYEDYDNFLTNDINWYTFLLLFRLTSYEGNSIKKGKNSIA